jgi:hypothetical protein
VNTTETEDWLENIAVLRHNLADNLYDDNEELEIIWNMRVALENAITLTKGLNEEKIILCDRFELLTCFADKTTNLSPSGRTMGKCGCYSKNETFCAQTNATDCHLRDESMHTVYIKELDKCMILEGAHCPMAPTNAFCMPGLSCLTRDNHRTCDLENVAALYGDIIGNPNTTLISFSKTRKEAPG